MLDRPFLDKLLCIHVTRDAPGFPLDAYAAFICDHVGGRVIQRLGAPWIDEAYWDIQVGDGKLVLHYQHYLGIFLCAGGPEEEPIVERLLGPTEEFLSHAEPRSARPRMWRRVLTLLRRQE